jgi:rapamycin-insensitive companion of mTOR
LYNFFRRLISLLLLQHIRLFATEHLASLLRSSTSSHSAPCHFSAHWQIALLVQQLYDSAPEVVQFALETLEKACNQRETLELVVGMRPALDLLGEAGEGLLTRCVFESSSL